MPRPLTVTVVNGTPNENSRTMVLADLIVDELRRYFPLRTTRVDVYRLGADFTSALSPDDITPQLRESLDEVAEADVVIAATPVFRGSYPGLFKHFFDLIDRYALTNKIVIVAATGGSARHALALEHALRPLFGFFQALVAPVAVYAVSGDIDAGEVLNPEVHSRVQVGVHDVKDIIAMRRDRPAPTVPGQSPGRVLT